jgi:RNA polymerase sigma-70 factor, ECF subfamily
MKLIPSTHAADQRAVQVHRRSPGTHGMNLATTESGTTVVDDSREFERFARPHAAAALRLARTLVANEADAQDVLQDSFLRAFRHFRGFSGESPRAWLLSIVRNVSFTLWRKQQRTEPDERETVLEAEPDPGPSPEARLLEACDAELVQQALGQLPTLHREVLVLREMEECSYREIACVLGVPIGTVMSRLSRARAQLIRKLAGDLRSRM